MLYISATRNLTFLRNESTAHNHKRIKCAQMRYSSCPWCDVSQEDMLSQSMVWIPGWGRYPAVSSLSEISWSQWFSFFPSYAKVVFLHGFQGQAWLQVWWCISSHVLLQVSAWLDAKGCLSKVPISLQADTVRRFINHIISDYCLTLFDVWWLFHVPFFSQEHSPAYRFSATFCIFWIE